VTPFIDPWWLPVIFGALMGLSILLYVILDGYDLGVGMLTVFEPTKDRDLMVASIGPFWDANETWLVLGIGLLLVAFPAAHGLILTQLYLPVARTYRARRCVRIPRKGRA
jgi:cytochrome bd ubiquinol oxidase subunit II